MNLKTPSVFALGALSALGLTALAQQSTPKLADFRIQLEVKRAENGVQMVCTEGCAWNKLSFSCDSQGEDCLGSFDQYGTPAE